MVGWESGIRGRLGEGVQLVGPIGEVVREGLKCIRNLSTFVSDRITLLFFKSTVPLKDLLLIYVAFFVYFCDTTDMIFFRTLFKKIHTRYVR